MFGASAGGTVRVGAVVVVLSWVFKVKEREKEAD